jgi:AcrR family transcriptional regulator
VFTELATDVTMEEIARRAGVGIGTLYRNFATRGDLIECVYVAQVDALCRFGAELTEPDSWAALVGWLRRFVTYVGTKRALVDGLNRKSRAFAACREASYVSGARFLADAQQSGAVRHDATIDDVMPFVIGITIIEFADDGQRERVLTMALDGLRTPPTRHGSRRTSNRRASRSVV